MSELMILFWIKYLHTSLIPCLVAIKICHKFSLIQKYYGKNNYDSFVFVMVQWNKKITFKTTPIFLYWYLKISECYLLEKADFKLIYLYHFQISNWFMNFVRATHQHIWNMAMRIPCNFCVLIYFRTTWIVA